MISLRAKKTPPSGIRFIFNIARNYENVIEFTLGQPDFDTPNHIREAAKSALDAGFTRYTHNAGIIELREAIAEKVSRENNLQVDPNFEVIVTPGGQGALFIVMLTMLDPGDEVLVPDPGYPVFTSQIIMAGGKPVYVPVREEEEFILTRDVLERQVSSKTKMLIINSPSNPTGSVMTRKDLEEISDFVQEHDLFVVSDEAYEKMVYDDGINHYSIANLQGMKDRTISIFSFSKTYAMPGWRVGYAVGNRDVISHMIKLQEHVSSHVSSVSQMAALAALKSSQHSVRKMVEEYASRRNLIVKLVNDVEGLSCLKPKGAFYLFVNHEGIPKKSFDLSLYLLKEGRVATVPGSEFGVNGEKFLRLSYCVSKDKIEEGINRIDKTLNEVRK